MPAPLIRLEAACTAADDLAEAVEEAFPQHPDAEITLGVRGLRVHLGARVLAEIGGRSQPVHRRRRYHGDSHASGRRDLFSRVLGQHTPVTSSKNPKTEAAQPS